MLHLSQTKLNVLACTIVLHQSYRIRMMRVNHWEQDWIDDAVLVLRNTWERYFKPDNVEKRKEMEAEVGGVRQRLACLFHTIVYTDVYGVFADR